MKSKTLEFIRNNRSAQATVWVLGTIFLGALGSGLLEIALRDIFTGLRNLTLMLISTFWGGYVDLLHKSVGKLNTDLLSLPTFAMVTGLVLFGPWFLIIHLLKRISRLKNHLTKKADEEVPTPEELLNEINSMRKRVFQLLIPLMVFTTLFYAISFWQLGYTRNAGNWAEQSIEILRPYMSEGEYVKFRSDLRAVSTADQFYKLETKLREAARKSSTELPEFTVIRRLGAEHNSY